MNNRIKILVIFVIGISSLNLFAMPPNLLYDNEGFLEVSIGYTLSIPLTKKSKIGHNISLDLSWISKELWGGGCMLRLGENYFEFTGNIQKRVDSNNQLGIPLIFKFGIINSPFDNFGIGIGVESGLSYYFNEKSEPENIPIDALEFAEFNYNYFQGLFGLCITKLKKNGFILIPTTTINFGYATTPHASSGTYHVY